MLAKNTDAPNLLRNRCKNSVFYDDLHETPMAIKGWHDGLASQCPPNTFIEILLFDSPLAKKIHLPCLKLHSGSMHWKQRRKILQVQHSLYKAMALFDITVARACPSNTCVPSSVRTTQDQDFMFLHLPLTLGQSLGFIGTEEVIHTHKHFNQPRNNHCRKDLACF